MSSPWKKKQPEVVAGMVLRRAEASKVRQLHDAFTPAIANSPFKMARKLRNRLALAHFKAKKGWEDLNLDLIEPRIDEELRRKRPLSSGDVQSDSSSSLSDFHYPRGPPGSSPFKEMIFSDAIHLSSSSSGHRKRMHHSSFQHPSSRAFSRKRVCSSPTASRSFSSTQNAWNDCHPIQSSPIKPRKHSNFTTTAGPDISLFRGRSDISGVRHTINYMVGSDDEDDLLPAHSFKMDSMEIRSSPPRTPPPGRSRASFGHRSIGKNSHGRSGEEGADLLLYLATSPSPAHPTGKSRMHPPMTPPPRNNHLPSSMMTTPGGTALLSAFGGPNTPSQAFDFADFVNITPSPAQSAWPKTPAALAVARRRLTFENNFFGSPDISPHGSNNTKQTGLGMQLGGELLS